jgi:hypothetical protein
MGDFVAKLANFKLSRSFDGVSTVIKVFDHVPWLAPEKLKVLGKDTDKHTRVPYTQKCEIFSFGMLLWELGHQRIPYKGMTPNQIEGHVLSGKRESFSWELDDPFEQAYGRIIRDGKCSRYYIYPKFLDKSRLNNILFVKPGKNSHDFAQLSPNCSWSSISFRKRFSQLHILHILSQSIRRL